MKRLKNIKKRNRKNNYVIKINSVRYETSYKSRFLNHIRTINWRKSKIKIHLRVSYPELKKEYGVTPFNSGTYTSKKDFELALAAFIE
jgi:hypothetical protein